MDEQKDFKAGYISIIGKPNVGKSTLMNALVGERLSIITNKAQTTRHRIFGILTSTEFQMIYSDTPGVIETSYKLQESMMTFVKSSLEDADIILIVVELGEKNVEMPILKHALESSTPTILVINKIDQGVGSQVLDKTTHWNSLYPTLEILPVSAITSKNTDQLFERILELLPVHPPYFPQDTLTDKTERFFASEMLREQIFLYYKQEIPYSCEVVIESFKESENIIHVSSLIYVERKSQKGIVIGKGGQSLKEVGTAARKEMEAFFAKQVHLEIFVKIEKDWRKNDKSLDRFGYLN
ncbi:MAG: GTP-binding protein Era [Cyclobacteriaceae bacterium]|jgi:GTP-binding protein Era